MIILIYYLSGVERRLDNLFYGSALVRQFFEQVFFIALYCTYLGLVLKGSDLAG